MVDNYNSIGQPDETRTRIMWFTATPPYFKRTGGVGIEGFEPSLSWFKTKRLRPLDDTPIITSF